jgi:hypothetical protein|eukprot:COSAG01_NODE_779_length_13670_cov_10.504974_1_plen_188_part_00
MLAAADPDYLIRYYRGPRDPARTEFASEAEANPVKPKPKAPPRAAPAAAAPPHPPAARVDHLPAGWHQSTDQATGRAYYIAPDNTTTWVNPTAAGGGRPGARLIAGGAGAIHAWEYDDGGAWTAYNDDAQAALEAAFAAAQRIVQIKSALFEYEIDLNAMMQTNVSHAARKTRQVRRVVQQGAVTQI